MHVLKMVVNTVKQGIDHNGEPAYEEITLSAVYSDKPDHPNKQWSQWTPTGNLAYTVNNKEALNKIRPGMFFLVNLVQCEKDTI